MKVDNQQTYLENLYKALSDLDSPEHCKAFLEDLCLHTEISAMAQRLEVARRINEGQVFSNIVAKTGASSMLVGHINSLMGRGGDGLRRALTPKVEQPCYSSFATVYDSLTHDVNYKARGAYVEKLFKMSGTKPHLLLDLACGTGSMSVEMARRGYDVIGVDCSADMLCVANEKAREHNQNILFLHQKMEEMELYGSVDAAICMLDSINYIEDITALKKSFALVQQYLNSGGVFIFDINTAHKLRTILPGNIFTGESDGCFYIWENTFDPEENICEFKIDFFVRKADGTYNHFTEYHHEYAYTDRQIKSALKAAGFTLIGQYEDLTFDPPARNSQKVFYVAKKE